jgi:fructose-6-phosphate aldolase 1
MELYLDTTDVNAVRRLSRFLPVAGVTTNPTLVARGGFGLAETLSALRQAVGPDRRLFAQVLSESTADILAEADRLRCLDDRLVVKIPVTAEGLAAIAALRERGIPTLGTVVHAPMPGLLAALAGAAYVAPYVGRIDGQGGDGLQCVRDLQALLARHAPQTRCLAASLKSVRQVVDCLLAGCDSLTLPVDLADQLVTSPAVDAALAQFRNDWQRAFDA